MQVGQTRHRTLVNIQSLQNELQWTSDRSQKATSEVENKKTNQTRSKSWKHTN